MKDVKPKEDRPKNNGWMKGKIFDILLLTSALISVITVIIYANHNRIESAFGDYIILYYTSITVGLFFSILWLYYIVKIGVMIE